MNALSLCQPSSLRLRREAKATARRIGVGLACLAFVAAFFAPTFAAAQHEGDTGQAPPPPAGPGELVVQVVSGAAGSAPDSLEGLPIALYALAPDGTPGLANGVTDANGRHVFSGISNDPTIVYLLGARFAEIPFGERVAFAEGATQARVEIKVSKPTDQVRDVQVEELRARVDWMGDRIVVTEILRLRSGGDRVIQLSSETIASAAKRGIVARPLPAGAKDFNAGPSSIGDDLMMEGGVVRFFGPLYPGDQRLEYQYSLPLERSGSGDVEGTRLSVEMREAIGRVVVAAGTAGIDVSGNGLIPSRELATDDGQSLSAWASGALQAGRSLTVELGLPESRLDPTAITLPRADVWVDLDDTRVNANVDLQLLVSPGAPVSGTPDAPLLHVAIPLGAELQGVSPDTESMGLVPTADGGFDVIGPIPPGQQSIGYAYRLASRPDGVSIGMQFPREVETLNVLIADTGLALDSSRLHRRRPFRSGTRNYLHREAFNVGIRETVDLELEPLRAAGIPQQASMAIVLLAAAAGSLFLIAPLRSATAVARSTGDVTEQLRDEREAVYTAIRDLDHDFETGKLDDNDYASMRDEFKQQAIALMRAEREAGGTAAAKADSAATASGGEATTVDGPAIGAFCPGCGVRIDGQWKFCSHCGQPLASDAGSK